MAEPVKARSTPTPCPTCAARQREGAALARTPMTAEEVGRALMLDLPPEYRGRPVVLDFSGAMVADVWGVTWGTGLRGYYVALQMGTVRPHGIED